MTVASIEGPSGRLEVSLTGPAEAMKAAVVAHPHPLYGGTMDDAVVMAAAAGCELGHAAAARFNFRGVGHSEGRYDGGVGERDDYLAVVDWLRAEQPANCLIAAGYSFGAAVAASVAIRARADAIVLVAPPLRMLTSLALPDVPTLVILGENDSIVDCAAASEVFAGRVIEVIPDADHFFYGLGDRISNLIGDFLDGT